MIQNEVGKSTEEDLLNFFKRKKYWAYLTPRTTSGQPVDIIAMSGSDNWLVDAKHLENNKKSFPFDRVEANQEFTMRYAREMASIQNIGIVILTNNEFFYLSYDKYKEMSKNAQKSVKIADLPRFEEVIDNVHNNN